MAILNVLKPKRLSENGNKEVDLEMQELAKQKTIEGICWNTICLYKDRLLVRSEIEAACFQLPITNPVSDNSAAVSVPSDETAASEQTEPQESL